MGTIETAPCNSAKTPRILAITPARNERTFLQATIASMVSQKVRPTEWILVDDGSTDGTREVAEAAVRAHPWIRLVRRPDRGRRAIGGGVVEAFSTGFEASELDWDYVCKVDADIEFGPLYLATVLEMFEADERLGSVSGKYYHETAAGLVEERICDDSVAGCFKTYSRACYAAIGGLHPDVMWDGIDFHRARQEGFTTGSVRDERLQIVHRRRVGSPDHNALRGRWRHGTGQYCIGTHPLYLLASAASRLTRPPFALGSLAMVAGYLTAALQRRKRYDFPGFRKELHRWQWARLRRIASARGGPND